MTGPVSGHSLGHSIDALDLPELFILRHGQTEWNAESRMQGSRDSALTATGRAQAAQQGEILAALGVSAQSHRIIASPQGRAQTTAAIIAQHLGAPHTSDVRLSEIRIAGFEGRTRADLEHCHPEVFRDLAPLEWYFRVPDGETYDQMRTRVAAFLAEVRRPSVIVTHGMTSRFLRGMALGLDRAAMLDLPCGQGVVHHLFQKECKLIATEVLQTRNRAAISCRHG